jgi:hypothetical protein
MCRKTRGKKRSHIDAGTLQEFKNLECSINFDARGVGYGCLVLFLMIFLYLPIKKRERERERERENKSIFHFVKTQNFG